MDEPHQHPPPTPAAPGGGNAGGPRRAYPPRVALALSASPLLLGLPAALLLAAGALLADHPYLAERNAVGAAIAAVAGVAALAAWWRARRDLAPEATRAADAPPPRQPPQPSRRTVAGAVAGAGFALALTGVLLAAAELALGPALLGLLISPDHMRPDAWLEYRTLPGARFEWNGTWTYDARGRRIVAGQPDEPDGPVLLLLGDSVAHGHGLGDADSFASALRRAGTRRWWIENETQLGWSLFHYHYALRRAAAEARTPARRPRLVVVVLCLNDWINNGALRLIREGDRWAAREPVWRARLRWFLRAHSALYNLPRLRDRWSTPPPAPAAVENEGERALVESVRWPEAFWNQEVAADAWLRGLRDTAVGVEAGLVAVIVPFRVQLDPAAPGPRRQAAARIAERLRLVCGTHGIPVLVVTDALAAHLAAHGGPADALFFDYDHLSAAGMRVAAEATAAWIEGIMGPSLDAAATASPPDPAAPDGPDGP